MRINYNDPIHQLNLLINTVLEEKLIHKELDAQILVSKDEMIALIRHARARATFPEHFAYIDEKRSKLESKNAKLHEKKERVPTLEERSEIFDQISKNEEAIANLGKAPVSIVSRGVTIAVSLQG